MEITIKILFTILILSLVSWGLSLFFDDDDDNKVWNIVKIISSIFVIADVVTLFLIMIWIS